MSTKESKWTVPLLLCVQDFLCMEQVLISRFRKYIDHLRFTGEKIMEWTPLNPDFNPMENPWLIMKRKLYESSKQYKIKANQWKEFNTITSEIEHAKILKRNNINGKYTNCCYLEEWLDLHWFNGILTFTGYLMPNIIFTDTLIIYDLQTHKVKLVTVVEGYPKATFSIATTPKCKGERYSFPWIAPLYPWNVPDNAEC